MARVLRPSRANRRKAGQGRCLALPWLVVNSLATSVKESRILFFFFLVSQRDFSAFFKKEAGLAREAELEAVFIVFEAVLGDGCRCLAAGPGRGAAPSLSSRTPAPRPLPSPSEDQFTAGLGASEPANAN